jgi:16S rRNA (guanine527-N7)-methyltransferase
VSDLEELRAALPRLVTGAGELGIDLSPQQCETFIGYGAALLERNRVINLTAIRTPEGVMSTLFLDSLTLLLAVPRGCWTERMTVCDVGAGAGIPGLPLKIACPEWEMTLIESIGKKAHFLDEVVAHLDLSGVAVYPDRAEVAGADSSLRDSVQLCVARAVAPLPTLLEWCAPLVRPGGHLLFPKSGDTNTEIASAAAAARALRVRHADTVRIPDTLGLGVGRVIVRYEKRGPTAPHFPRRIGLARTQPIG